MSMEDKNNPYSEVHFPDAYSASIPTSYDDANPGTVFLIEPWAAAKRKCRSSVSADITLAVRQIPRKAFASSAQAWMRASIFSITAGITTAAKVKFAWATRYATGTAKKHF